MTILEIISGVLLILASIAIVILVLLQDSKGNGLAGEIGGGEMMMDGRSRTPSSLMVKYTKVAAVVLFVLTIGVNVISALAK